MSCQPVSNSFESIQNHDYYSAFKGFDKQLKKDSSACAYGLSLYYDSHVLKNLDSSIKYILISEDNWPTVSEKKRLNWAAYNFDSLAIDSHKQQLGDQVFSNCSDRNSISCFDSLINSQSWSRNLKMAIFRRDSLVLDVVLMKGDLDFSRKMIHNYPNSLFMSELAKASDLFEYQTYVQSFHEEELVRFIELFPNNQLLEVVEDSIYSIYVAQNDYQPIEVFLEKHPDNNNVSRAWKELYRRYTKNFTPELIPDFELNYPEYPFKDEINLDSELADIVYYPFADSSGKVGYSDSLGSWLIAPEYDDASFFYNGLAAIEKDGKQGLINKKNELITDVIFDEIETDAMLFVVNIGDKYGVVNRNGDFVFDTIYQDISILDGAYICALKDSLYAFYNRSGIQVTSEMYDFVLNFKFGVCPVSIKGKLGLLDSTLRFIIPCDYEAIYTFSDSLFILENEDNSRQLCTRGGEKLNDSLYQEIHKVINGFSICAKESKIGYLNELGKQVIDNKFDLFHDYDRLGNFINGRAVIKTDKKFGIIDTTGKILLKPQF